MKSKFIDVDEVITSEFYGDTPAGTHFCFIHDETNKVFEHVVYKSQGGSRVTHYHTDSKGKLHNDDKESPIRRCTPVGFEDGTLIFEH